jgi:flagellar hook assembly protein FlgD
MRGKKIIGRGVLLIVAVALLLGLPVRPAFAAVPGTTPTFTAPTDAATVSGDVILTATSTAPKVQFSVAGLGAIGAPVPVVAGSASTTWPSWGFTNGAQIFSAADCNDEGCNPTDVDVTVTLDNDDPVITAPTEGSTTSFTPKLTGTVAGGALKFLVDDNSIGVDTTGPFEKSVPSADRLAVGAHTGKAVACNAAGTVCAGPESTVVNFTVDSLEPSITSISPSKFSPNGDGRLDTTTVTYSLPDTETVSWFVRSGNTNVKGPYSLGSKSAGPHTFTWSGKGYDNKPVPSGSYQMVITTTANVGGVDLKGIDEQTVSVDTRVPSISGTTGNNTTFYPIKDGVGDNFSPTTRVDEPGTLWLYIYSSSSGAVLRVIGKNHSNTGTFAITWDGKASNGNLLPPGTYKYAFVAQDPSGNRRYGSKFTVFSSGKRLKTFTTTITKRGIDRVDGGGSASCAGTSTGSSAFRPTGLLLVNNCTTGGNEAALAVYQVTAPAAPKLLSAKVETVGTTTTAPTAMLGSIWDFANNEPDILGAPVAQPNGGVRTTYYGNVGLAGRVGPGRVIEVAIFAFDFFGKARYDIKEVKITIGYQALA